MKILKKGKLPVRKKEVYEGTCNQCGCKVQCEEDDPVVDDWGRTPFCRCPTPECGQLINLHKVVFRG